MDIKLADRLGNLPPYLFAEIDRMKAEAASAGKDIISLGIGDPDLPTPDHIIEQLDVASRKVENHQYPSYVGMMTFREACAEWYENRFKVSLDPNSEALTLIGSKEGIAHIPLAFVNPGDYVLIPDPGYPVYEAATYFADGKVHFMPLKEENGFLPLLEDIPSEIAKASKIIFVNYPNNPTAACADLNFYNKLVEFAQSYDVIVCSDNAYSEMFFDGVPPLSFLNADGAKNVGIEFHSLSKTYNMTGWRIACAVGNPEVLSGLGSIKTNVDSGAFQAIQEAGIRAITSDQSCVAKMRSVYQTRRDVAYKALRELNLEVNNPQATFYMWIKCPEGYSSTELTAHILTNTGVVTTPGVGFGQHGEGYIRMALSVPEDRLLEAFDRIKKVGF